MPIYEYQCNNCGYEFRKMMPVIQRDLVLCEKCTAKNVRRKIGCGGFSLKGGGWGKDSYGKGLNK